MDEVEVSYVYIGFFKNLCLDVVLKVVDGKFGYGVFCDSWLGCEVFYCVVGMGLWIGYLVEWLVFWLLILELEIGLDFGGLLEWLFEYVVKVLCFYYFDDVVELKVE